MDYYIYMPEPEVEGIDVYVKKLAEGFECEFFFKGTKNSGTKFVVSFAQFSYLIYTRSLAPVDGSDFCERFFDFEEEKNWFKKKHVDPFLWTKPKGYPKDGESALPRIDVTQAGEIIFDPREDCIQDDIDKKILQILENNRKNLSQEAKKKILELVA